jgi:ribonuclease T
MYELGACVVGNEKLRFEKRVALISGAECDLGTLHAMGETELRLRSRMGQKLYPIAMRQFSRWVRHVCQGRKAVFVANNAPFDWMFIAWYFSASGIENPFGHSALDMKAYFMGRTNCSWKKATLQNMATYGEVVFEKLPHRAIEDAVIQSEIFSALLNKGERL